MEGVSISDDNSHLPLFLVYTMKSLWVDKYRPQTFDDYVFQDDVTKLHIMKFVEDKSIPHLMFSGPPGTGKTTCAYLLIQLLEIDPMDVLEINASLSNNVDTVRTRIDSFCAVAPMNSDFKICLLEEADYLTAGAQAGLRRLMELQSSNVRFIMTCNYPHKLKHAINSRLQQFEFAVLPEEYIANRIVKILDAEKVEWDPSDLATIIQRSPRDLRKIIQLLEQYTVNGRLMLPTSIGGESDTEALILDHISHDNWDGIRSYVSTAIADDQIVDLYRVLYNNLHVSPKFKNDERLTEQAIVTIAEYLYRSGSVADQYINFAALLIELKRINQ